MRRGRLTDAEAQPVCRLQRRCWPDPDHWTAAMQELETALRRATRWFQGPRRPLYAVCCGTSDAGRAWTGCVVFCRTRPPAWPAVRRGGAAFPDPRPRGPDGAAASGNRPPADRRQPPCGALDALALLISSAASARTCASWRMISAASTVWRRCCCRCASWRAPQPGSLRATNALAQASA